ncbi:MAG: hypothetical protein LAT62_11120 [Natronospirillum sp.]|nr:hypothetical protein [Natronospirillum sp.]MCH8552480.1 hypothetical protein [Natronospirillum sp.]
MTDSTRQTKPDAAARLPCRGCTADCINYPVCDGKPWRKQPPVKPVRN